MITRRVLMQSATSLLFAQALRSQGAGGAKVVFQRDVPDLTLKNWSATAVEVSYAPGESSAAHRHPGITIAYVLEGEIRSKVGDEPERIYTAGQMFLETPGQLHAREAGLGRGQGRFMPFLAMRVRRGRRSC